MSFPESGKFLNKLNDMIHFLILLCKGRENTADHRYRLYWRKAPVGYHCRPSFADAEGQGKQRGDPAQGH